MKIVVFSLGIIFKGKVQGGSQKILFEVSKGLGERGHKVDIYCPYRTDNSEIFEINKSVVVYPILPLKGTFPMPYDVSPFALYQTSEILNKALEDADLLYCHDGGLIIEFLKNKVPTVISLRDFCYSETLLGALNFKNEAIIVNSDHTYNCLMDSFARINPNIKNNTHVIYNGYDSNRLKKCNVTKAFLNKYELPEKNSFVIGFPHRPQTEKGFLKALELIKKLKSHIINVKLLIPLYMDKGKSDRTDDTYKQIFEFIDNEQLNENVIFHRWIDFEDIPQYFSYCDVSLCIGNFVEAFSNVAIESLLCLTPVVVSNVATYRTMPIRDYINIVDYDDIDATCNTILKIQRLKADGNEIDSIIEKARDYIVNNLTNEKCIDGFEKVFQYAISNVNEPKKLELLGEKSNKYRLSSWCSFVKGRIYDDYKGYYINDPFNGCFKNSEDIVSRETMLEGGIEESVIDMGLEKGVIVEL